MPTVSPNQDCDDALLAQGGAVEIEDRGEGVAGHNALWEGVSDGEIDRGKPLIKLDPWHVKHRLIQPAHVANGTYGPWCIHVSKAFAIQPPELLEAPKMVVRKREVARSLYGQYAPERRRHAPTVIPQPRELLIRLRQIVRAFTGVKDAKTGGKSFRSGMRPFSYRG